MKEISVNDIGGIRIGHAEDPKGGTGCTVFIAENGMRAGLDVRGGGPASRETLLLDPLTAAQEIHAIVLGGGSAYGLDAAGGVMECLEERGIGLDVGMARVPLVVQSDIFDLGVGDPKARPDKAMGRKAALCALDRPGHRDGNHGAGCGATVGKICGGDTCMKTGIGSYAVQVGELQVGAVVVLNALGDVFDYRTGRQIAGLLTEDRKSLRSTVDIMKTMADGKQKGMADNTTIGVVITNADLDKSRLCKIAGMAQDGLAMSIRPVHTSMDGDSIYAVSVGKVSAAPDLVGTLAAEAVSMAVINAVMKAESAFGIVSAVELGL
ncbi:MAG: P1 family peptidase [Ruminococcus sp.]|nr:P1 family peptidase [Ruminococcus sp.]